MMFEVPELKNFQDLVGKYIDNEKKIVEIKVTRYAVANRNFGTPLVDVDIVIKDESRYTQEIVSVVVKTIPQRKYLQKVINSEVSFKNEVSFYQTVIPTLKGFLQERGTSGIDYFPKLYGARLNLDGEDDRVDQNGLLVLEGLKSKGYMILDRIFGCDLPTTKVILKNLAHFHAVPLALNNIDPETFAQKVILHVENYKSASCWTCPEKAIVTIVEILKESVTCLRTIPKIRKCLENCNSTNKTKTNRHFNTICHNDLWTKNILVKFNRGNPDKIMFTGHAFHVFDSLARDIVLLFFTSVQTRVLRNNFDELLRFYYQNFIETLKDLKVSTTQFSFELFIREFALSTSQVIGKALFIFLFLVFVKESGSNSPVDPPSLNSRDDIPLTAKEKVWWFVEECERRGWLNI